MRSWSGPVETDFQGRLRFSYANRPGYPSLTPDGNIERERERESFIRNRSIASERLSQFSRDRRLRRAKKGLAPHPWAVNSAH